MNIPLRTNNPMLENPAVWMFLNHGQFQWAEAPGEDPHPASHVWYGHVEVVGRGATTLCGQDCAGWIALTRPRGPDTVCLDCARDYRAKVAHLIDQLESAFEPEPEGNRRRHSHRPEPEESRLGWLLHQNGDLERILYDGDWSHGLRNFRHEDGSPIVMGTGDRLQFGGDETLTDPDDLSDLSYGPRSEPSC